MGDLFHEQVPDEFIDQMFGVMALAPQHTFLVLTKRPDRMQGYMKRLVSGHCSLVNAAAPFRTFGDNRQALDIIERANAALPNVWLGVTAENQHWADVRIPLLLDTPGKHWVSLEPLLGAIEFPLPCKESRFWGGISWLVVGGESGPGHRRMELAWADSISEQCYAAGVPYYGKQIAGNQPGQPLPGALGRKELPWTR
jgi:protein gp37